MDDDQVTKNPNLAMFRWRSSIRLSYVVGGVIALLAMSAVLVIAYTSATGTTSTLFQFIALLVLFMTALAITAAVFSGLQLSDKAEAFGLPTGSVRALLAVGMIILFVVFGLPLIAGKDGEDGARAYPRFGVPYDRLAEETRRYAESGYLVVVTNYGTPAPPGQERQATIELRPPEHSAERWDVSKQLITALVTLLTSVVSFYFGSRSATDAIKPDAKSSDASSDLSLRRKELSTRVEALKTALTDRGQKIEEAKTAPDPTDPAEAAARQQARNQVDVRRTDLENRAKTIADLLVSADQAIANLNTASPSDARAVNEQAAKQSLSGLADSLAATEALLPAYDSEIEAYAQASAVG